MKKAFILILLVLLGGAQASKAQQNKSGKKKPVHKVQPANVNRFIEWIGTTTYQPTTEDVAYVAYNVQKGNIKPNTMYSLPGGQKFKLPYPEKWFTTLLACYQEVDKSVTTENLVSTIRKDHIIKWDINISGTTKNYYINPKGEVSYKSDYTGLGRSIMMHNGYIVMITDCFNPQGQIQTATALQPLPKEEPRVAQPTKAPEKYRSETPRQEFVQGMPYATSQYNEFQLRGGATAGTSNVYEIKGRMPAPLCYSGYQWNGGATGWNQGGHFYSYDPLGRLLCDGILLTTSMVINAITR